MKKIRGMQDLYGKDLEAFEFIISKAKQFSKVYNFTELKLPHIEFVNLFEKNLGEETDVVTKEIYQFEDKGGEKIALRPEFTASVVRAFLENNFKVGSRFFSYGSLFRYERPQKGRYREFSQINFEILGEDSFLSDAEIISMAYNLLVEFGIEGKFELEINTLGSKETMENYKQSLVEYFKKQEKLLSELSKKRLLSNPLRILDSKEKEDIEICKNAPLINNYYSKEEKERFANLQQMLTKLNIPFKVNYTIVRGLDYYTGVVFEFVSSEIGAKSTILGGGRYNNLVEKMGGESIPAIGFAGGIERITMLYNLVKPLSRAVFILPITLEEAQHSLIIANQLRKSGVHTSILYNGNLGKRIEKILKEPFESFALIVGKEEIKTGIFKIKNLGQNKEQSLTLTEIINLIYAS